jgi:hypothetical protein
MTIDDKGAKHVELIAEVHGGVDVEHLRQRLHHEGVQTLPMKVGLLVSGRVAALRAIIPSLTGEEQAELQVPEHLKDAVRAIRLVKPRSLR